VQRGPEAHGQRRHAGQTGAATGGVQGHLGRQALQVHQFIDHEGRRKRRVGRQQGCRVLWRDAAGEGAHPVVGMDAAAQPRHDLDLWLPERVLEAPDLAVHIRRLVRVEIGKREVAEPHARKVHRSLAACAADSGNDHVQRAQTCQRLRRQHTERALEAHIDGVAHLRTATKKFSP
jgi:hypothetical protein